MSFKSQHQDLFSEHLEVSEKRSLYKRGEHKKFVIIEVGIEQ